MQLFFNMSTNQGSSAGDIKRIPDEFSKITVSKEEFYRALNMSPDKEQPMMQLLRSLKGGKDGKKITPELQKIFDEYVDALEFGDEIDQEAALNLIRLQNTFLKKARDILAPSSVPDLSSQVTQYLVNGAQDSKRKIHQLFMAKMSEVAYKNIKETRASIEYDEMKNADSKAIARLAKEYVNLNVGKQDARYPIHHVKSLWILMDSAVNHVSSIAEAFSHKDGSLADPRGILALQMDYQLTDEQLALFYDHPSESVSKEDVENIILGMRRKVEEFVANAKAKDIEIPQASLAIKKRVMDEFQTLIDIMYSGNPVITSAEMNEILRNVYSVNGQKYVDAMNAIKEKITRKQQKALDDAAAKMQVVVRNMGLPLLIDVPAFKRFIKIDAEAITEIIDNDPLIPDAYKKANRRRSADIATAATQALLVKLAKEVAPEMPKKLNAKNVALRTRAAHVRTILKETNLQTAPMRAKSMKRNGLSIEKITDEFEKSTALLSQEMPSKISQKEYLDFCVAVEREVDTLRLKLEPYMRDEYARYYLQDVIDSRQLAKAMALSMFSEETEESSKEGIGKIPFFLKFQNCLPDRKDPESHEDVLFQNFIQQSDLLRDYLCPDALTNVQEIDDVASLLIHQAKFNTYYYKASALARIRQQDQRELTDVELQELTNQWIDAIQLTVDWAKAELLRKQNPVIQNSQSEELLPEPDPVKVLQGIDIKNGIPRDLIRVLFMRASDEADKESGGRKSGFDETIDRAVNMFLPEVIYAPLEMAGFLAWLYGNIVSINLGKGEGEIADDLIKTRELNLEKIQNAQKLINAKSSMPGIRDASLQQMIYFVEQEIKERSDTYLERDLLLDELAAGIRDAQRKFTKKRGHLLSGDFEKLPHFIEQIVERFYIIAKRHIPEKIYSPIMIRLLLGISEETFLSVYFHLKNVPNSGDAARALKQSLSQTYANILVAPNNILADSMKKVTDPKYYPLIRLQQDAQSAAVEGPERVTPAEYWKQRIGSVLAANAGRISDDYLNADAYFASQEQQEKVQKQLHGYFTTLENAFHKAIDSACAMNAIPSRGQLKSCMVIAATTTSIPADLPALIRGPLELLQIELEDQIVQEFSESGSGTSDIALVISNAGCWAKTLAPMFAEQGAQMSVIPEEVLQSEAAPVKNRAAAAMVNAILKEATGSDTGPISTERFSVEWIPEIYTVVSKTIDDHMQREPKRGKYASDVLKSLFTGTKQLVLRTRIGSAVEAALRDKAGAGLQEVMRKVRSMSAIDLLSGDAPDAEGATACVLTLTGRSEGMSFMAHETMIADQFLRQTLVLNGQTPDEQLLENIESVERLVAELNRHCHFGYALRKSDELLPILSGRGAVILEEKIASAEAQPAASLQSPEAQELASLVRENAEWIARWPSGAKTSEAQAGFLQILMRWHEQSAIAAQQLSRGSSVVTGTMLLNARCVAMARQKNIVLLKENGRSGNGGKAHLQVQHYKIRALLDWRDAQELSTASTTGQEVDMRTSDVIVTMQTLGQELAALESVLEARGNDDYPASVKALADASEKLQQSEAHLASIEAQLTIATGHEAAIRAQLPSLIAELQGHLILDAQNHGALKQQADVAAEVERKTRERLMAYSAKGADANRLGELSNEMESAAAASLAAQQNLATFVSTNAAQVIKDAIALFSAYASTEVSPASDIPPQEESLAKAYEHSGILDEAELLRQEKIDAELSVSRARIAHRALLAQNGGLHAPSGTTSMLKARRAAILKILTSVRSVLNSSPSDHVE